VGFASPLGFRALRPKGYSSAKRNPVMTTGTVKFFNETKGYGFISPDDGSKDVFVHISAVEASGLKTLDRDQKVEFDTEPDQRGPKAVNIKPV
jgi:CspA family cold shock protein